MHTIPYKIRSVDPDGPIGVSPRISPKSEAILILEFRGLGKANLNTAVLLPANANMIISFESDFTIYPILSPDCEVVIAFEHNHGSQERAGFSLAIITTISTAGEQLTRKHGL